jgi:hypothetical protein
MDGADQFLEKGSGYGFDQILLYLAQNRLRFEYSHINAQPDLSEA